MYELWLFLHLCGLVLLAAGLGVTVVSGRMAATTSDPALIATWAQLAFRSIHAAVMPGATVLLVAGTLLVHAGGFDFGAPWIGAAYGLWLVAAVLGSNVIGGHAKRVRNAARAEAEQGLAVSVDAARIASSRLGPIATGAFTAVILVILYLMVAKPS